MSNPTKARLAMTAAEVAREFNFTQHQVYRMAREGILPCHRFGRYVRFHRPTLEKMLQGAPIKSFTEHNTASSGFNGQHAPAP